MLTCSYTHMLSCSHALILTCSHAHMLSCSHAHLLLLGVGHELSVNHGEYDEGQHEQSNLAVYQFVKRTLELSKSPSQLNMKI